MLLAFIHVGHVGPVDGAESHAEQARVGLVRGKEEDYLAFLPTPPSLWTPARRRASWLEHPASLERFRDALSEGRICLSLYPVGKTRLLFNKYLFHFLLV